MRSIGSSQPEFLLGAALEVSDDPYFMPLEEPVLVLRHAQRGPVRTLLFIDGRMLGFGILVDDKILCHRLRVENVDSIVDADWSELSLPVPTSTVSDQRGAYLTYLLESPVLMSLPRSARFFYCMVAQWLKRFGARCRLVGGPDDYSMAPQDVHDQRHYTLEEFAAVMGNRYRHTVPNIAAWKHDGDVRYVDNVGFVDQDGVITGSAARSMSKRPVAKVPGCAGNGSTSDLHEQHQFELRSLGAKTRGRMIRSTIADQIKALFRDNQWLTVKEMQSAGVPGERETITKILSELRYRTRIRRGRGRRAEWAKPKIAETQSA